MEFDKKENSSNFKEIEKEKLIQENNTDYLVSISKKEIYDFQTDKKVIRKIISIVCVLAGFGSDLIGITDIRSNCLF